MSEKQSIAKFAPKFVLPSSIAGQVDLRRALRELENVDDFMYQSDKRSPGSPTAALPKISNALNQLSERNNISLLDQADRKKLIDILNILQNGAPSIHVSFAVEPTSQISERIVEWARENINPYLVVDFGLQPAIVVGCTVRSTNKVFDMSLRNRFKKSRSILVEQIEAGLARLEDTSQPQSPSPEPEVKDAQ